MSGRKYPELMRDLVTTRLLHSLHKKKLKAEAISANALRDLRATHILEDWAVGAYRMELEIEQRRQGWGVDLSGTMRKLSETDRKEMTAWREK